MRVELTVTTGPHAGRVIAFDRRDTFLVGRGTDAHFRLSADDPYFSRRHFLIEVNPPRAKLTDLNSRNGVSVNGVRVTAPTELFDGDEAKAGHAVFRVRVPRPDLDHPTLDPGGRSRSAVPSGWPARYSTGWPAPTRPGSSTRPHRGHERRGADHRPVAGQLDLGAVLLFFTSRATRRTSVPASGMASARVGPSMQAAAM